MQRTVKHSHVQKPVRRSSLRKRARKNLSCEDYSSTRFHDYALRAQLNGFSLIGTRESTTRLIEELLRPKFGRNSVSCRRRSDAQVKMSSDKRLRWKQQQRGLISKPRYAIEYGKFFIQLAFILLRTRCPTKGS